MSPPDTARGERLESLDTLRGVAIVMVVAYHVSILFRPAPWLLSLAKLGNQGVQLFFLISAITMCFMWQQRATETQRTLKFYIRRFMRIAPLFWLAICFYLPWEGMHDNLRPGAVMGPWQIALTALFLHGFSPSAINTVVPGGWSIAVEMSFYAVFPLLAARRWSPIQLLAFAFMAYLALGVVATTWVERRFAPDSIVLYYSLLTQFPIFPIGMFVYGVSMGGQRVNVVQVTAVVLMWLAMAFLGKYVLGLETRPFFWVQVGLFAVAIVLVVRRGLYLHGLAYVGRLSYSMYLFHFAIIATLVMAIPPGWREGTLSYVMFLALVLVATVAVAKISAVTFERWSADLAKAFIARLGSGSTRRYSAE
ncbi:MAG: acyltransferase [Rhizobacter sp.]|nr:acyltransferase [Rhizobacter sp.]